MATILLVGVDLFFRGKLEGLLPGHVLVTKDSAHPPDLVVCDIARIDPVDVADNWPDIPILGYTNHTDTSGLRAGHVAVRRSASPARCRSRSGWNCSSIWRFSGSHRCCSGSRIASNGDGSLLME